MAVFILVHGTFARDAEWTKFDSSLSGALSAALPAGDEAIISAVTWSGRNRGTDRWKASKKIHDQIALHRRRHPNHRIYLIGHSHGGSAIAYYLRDNPEAKNLVAGCAFLSTPLISLSVASQYKNIISSITTSSLIISIFIAGMLCSISAIYLSVKFEFSLHILSISRFHLPLCLASFLAILATYRVMHRRITSFVETTLPNRLSRRGTVSIPVGNYYFARVSGDEAASLLSASQFISLMLSKFLGVCGAPILRMHKILVPNQWSRSRAVVFLTAYFLLSFWAGTLVVVMYAIRAFCPDCKDYWIPFLQSIDFMMGSRELVPSSASIEWRLYNWMFVIVSYIGAPVIFLSIAYVAVLLLVSAPLSISLSFFGWLSFSEGIFANLAVEPLPLGSYTLHHVDPSCTPTDMASLNHSKVYAAQSALLSISDWIYHSELRLMSNISNDTAPFSRSVKTQTGESSDI